MILLKYNHVIIAPHPDDELIGCSEILFNFNILNKEVIVIEDWFNEKNTNRIKESENLANDIGYNIKILNNIKCLDLRITNDTIVWLPSISDNNIHHTYANVFARYDIEEKITNKKINSEVYIGEYTTKMNVQYKRLCKDTENKKNMLYKYFPSQKKYFDNFNDVYLFEGRALML